MASMNRGLNLPAIQRIMNEFEKENAMMDMKEEMMSDEVDNAMDPEEDEEEEGDKILKEVLDEIGVDLSQQVCGRLLCAFLDSNVIPANGCTNGIGDASFCSEQTTRGAG
jgi:division protein CdvB (Snf7/Vps24/ESCRT-III family)